MHREKKKKRTMEEDTGKRKEKGNWRDGEPVEDVRRQGEKGKKRGGGSRPRERRETETDRDRTAREIAEARAGGTGGCVGGLQGSAVLCQC